MATESIIYTNLDYIVGALVELRSGSPSMTIVGYGTKSVAGDNEAITEDKNQIVCQWWNEKDADFSTVTFPISALNLVIEDEDDYDFDDLDDDAINNKIDDSDDYDSEERVMNSLVHGDPEKFRF
ncbi:DUF2158 domain-containing protein [Spirosoma arcticum]